MHNVTYPNIFSCIRFHAHRQDSCLKLRFTHENRERKKTVKFCVISFYILPRDYHILNDIASTFAIRESITIAIAMYSVSLYLFKKSFKIQEIAKHTHTQYKSYRK